jgi:hypothetical protein
LMDTREPVKVFSDHANLRHFTTNQHLSDRQAQWAVLLSLFHFVIKHVSGRLNPEDPPTCRPNFLPGEPLDHNQRILIHPEEKVWLLQGATLDEEDPRIDIGEVSYPPAADQSPDSTDAPPSVQDFSYCPPSVQLCSLLQEAYLPRLRIRRRRRAWSFRKTCGRSAIESLSHCPSDQRFFRSAMTSLQQVTRVPSKLWIWSLKQCCGPGFGKMFLLM